MEQMEIFPNYLSGILGRFGILTLSSRVSHKMLHWPILLGPIWGA